MSEKLLTIGIIIVAILWILVFIRNLWSGNKNALEYQQYYNNVLHAEEFKVKGKFEQ